MVIGKQLKNQRYVFKINSSRLRNSDWDLKLSLSEARENDELVSISDSQMIRFIDELNNRTDLNDKVNQIRSEIKELKHQPHSVKNKHRIRDLYSELDEIQFIPDYLSLVMNSNKDYKRAVKGFKVNGISFSRLVGTNGGVKTKTIIFVNSDKVDELRRRIDNGRDMTKEMIPAKFEAYRALTCSGSIPVSMPKGVLIVDDCMTTFKESVIYINDGSSYEPTMEVKEDSDIELDTSDGYGLILPSLAERWSEELQLGYVSCGFNTRFPFEKGMVFAFDFLEFADEVAHNYMVKDVWGNDVDVRDVEMILTTSMVKLWDSYSSCEEYICNSLDNHYTFAVTKTAPEKLESERNLNYQFIQSYDLNDEQIDELISPTINEFKEVIAGDYRKAILFLKGSYLDDKSVLSLPDDYCKAMMIDKNIFNDPFVRNKIYQLIKKKIDDAKIGVIKVRGNYSIASGDPYLLCQSIFGLPKTGLLKAGEIYNKYWADSGVERLACYRAPMTSHNNIRLVKSASNDDMSKWYQYMTACTIFNGFDTASAALNGMDYDGDLVFLTDNKVLVDNIRPTLSIMCVQRKAEKYVPTEGDLVTANINSFGDDIGKITNRITSMFEKQCLFALDSEEYKVLDYRIKCGQLFQQNAIDKAKGIVAKPMPKEWYDFRCNAIKDDDAQSQVDAKRFNQSIVAERKPYFMIYIYPSLMKDYKKYVKSAQLKCLMEFRISLDEILVKDNSELTEAQSQFVNNYYKYLPVGVNDCVMNKICRRFEDEFDRCVIRYNSQIDFDYSVMKSGCNYHPVHYENIKSIFNDYLVAVQRSCSKDKLRRRDNTEVQEKKRREVYYFTKRCYQVCSSEEELCEILLDFCYQKQSTKQFVWDICRHQIISNLLKKNGNIIHYPKQSESGELWFMGNNFEMYEREVCNIYEKRDT